MVFIEVVAAAWDSWWSRAANLWWTVGPLLYTAKPIASSEIPGLLSGMGVVNTVAVFAYSTVLGRVAGIKYRRNAVLAFVFAWIAVVLVVLGYVLNSYWELQTGLFVDLGLLTWIVSFASALFFIYLGARDVVGRGTRRYERICGFVDQSATARFGVPFIDQVIERTTQAGEHVPYPFLLIHDIHSPGRPIATAYARSGLLAGEGVVYLSFSRPHDIIRGQISSRGELATVTLWIVDCYSEVYMPEKRGGSVNTFHADPRDPADVYRKYMKALTACRRTCDSVRVVYETLSDFLKIADPDLVMNYLRRVIVLEEIRHIRAVYFFWQGAVVHQVDATYLRWFFTATLDIVMPQPMVQPAMFQATFTRFFDDPVAVHIGHDLCLDEGALFQLCPPRVEALGNAIRRLSFVTKPYGFLPSFQGLRRARHLANFLFFMAAIDHDTHRSDLKFEDTFGDRPLHGSDLLYALAQQAKEADPTLFLPAGFAAIDDKTVASIFTSPAGKLPADIAGRAAIFRACSREMIKEYEGDANVLISRSNGRLGGPGGMLVRLKTFDAFSDPIAKKTALLVKLLIREGLFNPLDPENIEVAIDHVVMTMALRSGIVRTADSAIRQTVTSGGHLDQMQIDVLREVTRNAMHELAARWDIRPDEIDDLIWSYGRKSLRRPTPLDRPKSVHSELDGQLDLGELPDFVAVLNGKDAASEHVWPEALMVRGPFTRFY